MAKTSYRIILLILFGVIITASPARAKQSIVLLLHSYNQGNVWSDRITDSVAATIQESNSNAMLLIEYLDTKVFERDAIFPNKAEFLKKKYADTQPDVIISSDDNALDFLLKYGDDLFPGVPTIFCGVADPPEDQLAQKPYYTGVIEGTDVGGTLAVALKLHPATSTVAVISDRTQTGVMLTRQFNIVREKYAGRVSFVDLTNVSSHQLQETLARLPKDSIALFLSFFVDKDGHKISTKEMVRIVRTSFKGPVYSLWDVSVEAWATGGHVVSGWEQGRSATQLALSVLDGLNPSDIPFRRAAPNIYMFNYEQLTRFGVNFDLLPKGSELINKPDSLFYKYKMPIIIMALFVFVLTLLVIIMAKSLASQSKVRKELVESRERFELITKATGEGIWDWDLRTNNVYFSRRYKEILGYTDNEIVDYVSEWKSRIHPKDYDRVLGVNQECADGKVDTFEVKYRLRHKDGTWRWVQGRGTGLINDQGEVYRMAGTHADITARMQTEEALRQSEAMYRNLIKTTQQGYWQLGPEMLTVDVNPALSDLLGYERDEMLGRSPLDFVAKEGETTFRKQMHSAAKTLYRSYGVPLLHKDGHSVPAHINATTLRDENGELIGIFALITDITELKNTQARLGELNRKLEQIVQERTVDLNRKAEELKAANLRLQGLDEIKSRVISLVSHDLRTPLTSVMGFAKLIRRDFLKHFQKDIGEDEVMRQGSDQILANLDIIQLEGTRLARIINDFLDLQRIESGTLTWQDRNASPWAIARQASMGVQAAFENKPDVELKNEVLLDLPDVMVDQDRIVQVLVNLLDNGCRHTGSGHVRVWATIEDNNFLRFNVQDTGVGISKEDQDRIFERFSRADGEDTIRETPAGSGLGLAISRQIIAHYGGEITVDSKPDEGSLFTFTLPIAEQK